MRETTGRLLRVSRLARVDCLGALRRGLGALRRAHGWLVRGARPVACATLIATACATLIATACAAAVAPPARAASRPAARGHAAEPVTVGRQAISRPVAPGFVGLSIEQWALDSYAGRNPAAINHALVGLIRNLAPGQHPVLRFGGVSTDWTWWPIPGLRPPAWARHAVGTRWASVARARAAATDARLIMGINLESDSTRISGAEARKLDATIGAGRIEGLELGNEPELYGSWTWYVTKNGRDHTGRPADYDPAAYIRDVARIRGGLPSVPLAGPASGSGQWLAQLNRMIAGVPGMGLVTVHRYPLQACYFPTGSPRYPTIANLLAPAASLGLAQSVSGYVGAAHSHHLPLLIDEMNAVSCGNAPALHDSFALALWVLDALLADVQVGVDGVNIHTYPGSIGQLFTTKLTRSGWRTRVEPEYYGLLMFAHAAPHGAKLLKVAGPADDRDVRVWATHAPDGKVRVVAINDDTAHQRVLSLRLDGVSGDAALERLQAPSAGASDRVSIGGQTFGNSTASGQLTGTTRATAIRPSHKRYRLVVPRASAALLTVG